MPPIVSIVGRSKVGKTTLLERLIAELKGRGYRVAAVKHDIHGFDIDQPGKDSWRLAQAGSDAVVISAPDKLALMKRTDHDSSPEERRWLVGDDYDIILTEGYKQGKADKVEVHRSGVEGKLLCSPRDLIAVATDEPLGLGVTECPLNDVAPLADLLEERYLRADGKEEMSIIVNGTRLLVNPSVEETIGRALVAMVSTLKGVGEVKRLDVFLRRK